MKDAPPEDDPDALAATLADLLDDLAGEFDDIERRETPSGADYLVRTRAFTHLNGDAASFRLRPEIVVAAARTPSATASPLGAEWVAFRPTTLDQYSRDRLQSWFELAHRLVAEDGARTH